jgi:hypothetical protein
MCAGRVTCSVTLNRRCRPSMPRISPYDMRLSAEERLSLEPMARKYTSVYCDVIRAKIILLADEGLPNDLIAAIRAARSHAATSDGPERFTANCPFQLYWPAPLWNSSYRHRSRGRRRLGRLGAGDRDQSLGNDVDVARRPAIVPAAASRDNREPRAAELPRLYRDSALMPLRKPRCCVSRRRWLRNSQRRNRGERHRAGSLEYASAR